MLSAVLLATANASNRWLLAFSIAAMVVLAGGIRARTAARNHEGRSPRRGTRRRPGALVAVGPVIGLALAPTFGTPAVVASLGAAALALVGYAVEGFPKADAITMVATVVAALAAVVAGVRFGPTGVDAIDTIGAFLLIIIVTQTADGLGNTDSLATSIGAALAAGIFAPAAFGHQNGLASVMAGLAGACIAFLAFNLRPASLLIGRSGRLAIGFAVAVGALTVRPAPDAWRSLVVPLILLGLLVLDAAFVAVYRLRRRRPLWARRADHVVHRLVGLGWTAGRAVGVMVLAQVLLSAIALFTARALFPVWLGSGLAAVVLLTIGIEAARGKLEREPADGLRWRVKIGIGVLVVAVVAALVPVALSVRHTVDLMQQGRDEASRALSAARDGDTITAQAGFNAAARAFSAAHDELASPLRSGALAVPFVASNARAARELARIGTDLADAGGSLTSAVHPDALEVVNGQLPLPEVKRVTPELERGATVLQDALTRLDEVRAQPYLLSPVRDAIAKVHKQLAQATGEAKRAAAAAKLAPAIFGDGGQRRYLLVVQNNAESRATGGFIGSYGLMTAIDGKLHVDPLLRTRVWNEAVRAHADPKYSAPPDYVTRYGQFLPATTLQNINLSPDFPSVAQALMSLAPQAGMGTVDGVLSVDPAGLAALLSLTGPVEVAGWPVPIDASNVVNVTLRDAYAAFAETPERADFLGDVAQVAVDQATTGRLGKPAQLAKVLGKDAHEGHLLLGFARPDEQHLAEQLGVAERMAPVSSDAVALTTSNAAANKIDYYLDRTVDYRVQLQPNADATAAHATADLSITLDNTAPDSGLPQIVIGPYDARYQAGENRSYVSMYSPLRFVGATVDGKQTAVTPGIERGRNVYSLFTDIAARTKRAMNVNLSGIVKLHGGWYELEVRHQPTLNADRVHVSVDVPAGWRVDRAPQMERPLSRRATTTLDLERTIRLRVHVVPDLDTFDVWNRLKAGA